MPVRDYSVETSDGEILRVRRLEPADADRRGPPLVLLHGLAADHLGFHLPERSLADWFVGRGRDVWLPELRGHGASTKAGWEWNLEDYLERDLPAVFATIRDHTGWGDVDWVGHSMGGILLLAWGILRDEPNVRRGVAMGSALDYTVGESGFRALLALRPLLSRLRTIPFGAASAASAPLVGRIRVNIERFNAWPPNIEDSVARTVQARCFHPASVELLLSMESLFEEGGLRLSGGEPLLNRGSEFGVPTRLMVGSRDEQVSVEAVRHTAEKLGDVTEVSVQGRAHGRREEYGHWDLLVGCHVREETWPEVAGWLEEEDG